MTMNPREKDTQAKKEEPNNPNSNKSPKITPSSSTHWSNHENPRIVRVSRAFGGKDRHSKVCTIRGLRDRRIRLSVPTAIQLYDLQDRLSLTQPSKVVDWLIEATKNDIDKLPPLPMVPHNLTQLFHQQHTLEPPNSYEIESNDVPQSSYTKDVGVNLTNGEGFKMVEQENDDHQEGFGGFVAQNLFPLSNINQSCFPNMPYSNKNNPNYFHFDAPSLSLSQLGGVFPFSSNQSSHEYYHHCHQSQNNNLSPMMMNIPSSTSQLYLCPSATTIASLVPTNYYPPLMDQNEWRSQINNHLQQNPVLLPTTTLQLISSQNKSLALNVNCKTVVDDNEKGERNYSR